MAYLDKNGDLRNSRKDIDERNAYLRDRVQHFAYSEKFLENLKNIDHATILRMVLRPA